MRPKMSGVSEETREVAMAKQKEKEGWTGWTRSLSLFPSFHSEKIYDRVIKNSVTISVTARQLKAGAANMSVPCRTPFLTMSTWV